MILIPLPKNKHSRGDQVLNAEYFYKKGFASILPQNKLTYNNLYNTITHTLNNKTRCIEKMKKATLTIGNKKIIETIEQYEK